MLVGMLLPLDAAACEAISSATLRVAELAKPWNMNCPRMSPLLVFPPDLLLAMMTNAPLASLVVLVIVICGSVEVALVQTIELPLNIVQRSDAKLAVSAYTMPLVV